MSEPRNPDDSSLPEESAAASADGQTEQIPLGSDGQTQQLNTWDAGEHGAPSQSTPQWGSATSAPSAPQHGAQEWSVSAPGTGQPAWGGSPASPYGPPQAQPGQPGGMPGHTPPGASPWGAPSGQQPWAQGAPYGAAPGGPAGPGARHGHPQWGQSPYGQPGQPGQQPGAPQYPQQWGPGSGPGGPAGPGAPYGAPYGGAPESPKKRSLLWLWLLLVIVVLAGIVTAVWFFLLRAPTLEALYDECREGDAAACEDLFNRAEVGSEMEEFGMTCGGRTDGTIECAEADMSVPADSWVPLPDVPGMEDLDDLLDDLDLEIPGLELPEGTEGSGDTGSSPTPGAYDDPNGCMESTCEPGQARGDNPRMDALWDACEAGTMAACDDLYHLSGFGSEYEDFGYTCGMTQPDNSGAYCDPAGMERWGLGF